MKKISFFKIFLFKTLFFIWLFNLGLLLFIAGLILFNYSSLASPLIIRFNLFHEIDLVSEKTTLLGIYLTVFVFNILNGFFAEFFLYRERFLSYFLTSISVILNLLLLIIIGTIISFN